MKLVIFGATGGIGRQLVAQGLAAGHAVTVLVRNRATFTLQHERLAIIQGDVTDLPAVEQAVVGQDAVLSALGSNQRGPVAVCSDGVQHMLVAMAQHQVRRLLVVSAYGIGDSHHHNLYNVFLWMALKEKMVDKERMEEILRHSAVDWTLIRPSFLTKGPRTPNYHAGADLHMRLTSHIARADVADFMLHHITDAASVRQALAITA